MEYTVDTAIHQLERLPKYLFSNDMSKALTFAIDFLKAHSKKPNLYDTVDCIRYYCDYKSQWEWYRHVPTGKPLYLMRIGDLVELVKTGRLDNDCFSKNSDSKGRKLDSCYVAHIKYMLFMNGYITEEEYKTEWRK